MISKNCEYFDQRLAVFAVGMPVLLMLVLLSAIYPAGASTDNMLRNGDFETLDMHGAPSHWRNGSNWADVDVRHEVIAGRVSRGKALQIQSKRFRSGAVQFVQSGISIKKEHGYGISIWMKGDVEAPVTVQVRKRGKPYSVYIRKSFRVSPEWQKYEFKGTVKISDDSAYFMIQYKDQGTLWVDDARMEDLAFYPQEDIDSRDVNLLPNGSFETGLDRWGAMFRDTGEPAYAFPIEYENPKLRIDRDNPRIGDQAMRIGIPDKGRVTVTSIYVSAKPNTKYSVSLWLRSDRRRKVRFGIVGGEFGNQAGKFSTVGVDEKWREYKLNTKLPLVAEDKYFFLLQASGKGMLWMDGVQLKKNFNDKYLPSSPVEVGFNHKEGLFLQKGENNAQVDVNVFAHEDHLINLVVAMTDYYGQEQLLYDKAFKMKKGEFRKVSVPVPSRETGYYRLMAKVSQNDSDLDIAETAFGVVPAHTGADMDSPFGNHIRFNPEGFMYARALGVKWLRMHPPHGTKWFVVEQEEGKFEYFDKPVKEARDAGFHVLGLLSTTPRWVSSAPEDILKPNNHGYTSYPPVDLDAWERYVFNTVKHYKGLIDHWEVWNEPSAHTFLRLPDGGDLDDRADIYVQLLERAYKAAKEASPAAVIVGGCGTTKPPAVWFDKLFARGAYKNMDVLSYHYYRDDRASDQYEISTAKYVDQVKDLVKEFGGEENVKPIWHTEVGIRYSGTMFKQNDQPTSGSPLPGIEGPEYIVKRYVNLLTSGVDKWFYYTLNASGRIDRSIYTGLLEWNASPRPAAVAYSVLSGMLAGTGYTSAERVDLGSVKGGVFKGVGRAVYVLWTEGESLTFDLDSLSGDLEVNSYDLMGRNIRQYPIENKLSLPIDTVPTYFVVSSK